MPSVQSLAFAPAFAGLAALFILAAIGVVALKINRYDVPLMLAAFLVACEAIFAGMALIAVSLAFGQLGLFVSPASLGYIFGFIVSGLGVAVIAAPASTICRLLAPLDRDAKAVSDLRARRLIVTGARVVGVYYALWGLGLALRVFAGGGA
jgi:hypothetical protein